MILNIFLFRPIIIFLFRPVINRQAFENPVFGKPAFGTFGIGNKIFYIKYIILFNSL